MSNQNHDSNPPQHSPPNIQVKPTTEGHTETVNTAGIVYGGVGNTYNTQGDKECVENKIWELRSELTAMENEKKRRKDKVQKLELEIGTLKVEVEKFQQQTYSEREDAQSIKKKKDELKKEVQHHNDEITRLENGIQGLKEKIQKAEIKLGVLKLSVEDTTNALPALEKKVRDLMQDLEQYVNAVKAEGESIAELYRLMEKIEAEQAKQLEDEQRAKEELQRKVQNIEVKQAKQFEDDRKEREELKRQMQILLKVIEEKDKVLEEKDKDMRQLKDAGAAAEGKVQEPQDAVQEKTTQDKHGREEGKKEAGDLKTGPTYQQTGDEADQHGASSDVEERGVTATARETDGSVPRQGVTQKDSDPHHVDDLLVACYHGNMAEVKRVLDLGQVDINCRGWWSWTPVMWAAWRGQREVVELLLSRGADVSLVDDLGNHILHLACVEGDVGTVELILSLDGVDVNCRGGRWSRTPVMWAAEEGHREVVELLLSRGADVSLVDDLGNNILHWACMGDDVGTVRLILSLDVVDVNARNNGGQTAADMARDWGRHQLVDLLVSRAAR
ncbi:golgin candidate 4-like isoform X2 [Haliotis rubra]|uniref:golgin candidate 4-like isoform X2 n=1 Tax=Haliotis rubra TaxID=36100 RepID=UPI001EE601F4|nr:golgin candidate 4-like isoform X2 [Haliotis rubra]